MPAAGRRGCGGGAGRGADGWRGRAVCDLSIGTRSHLHCLHTHLQDQHESPTPPTPRHRSFSLSSWCQNRGPTLLRYIHSRNPFNVKFSILKVQERYTVNINSWFSRHYSPFQGDLFTSKANPWNSSEPPRISRPTIGISGSACKGQSLPLNSKTEAVCVAVLTSRIIGLGIDQIALESSLMAWETPDFIFTV